jgi:thioredoxin-related protein
LVDGLGGLGMDRLGKAFGAACFFVLAALTPVAAAELGDDGLHKEPWFSVTFKDVAEDIAAARAEGKRLAIIVEQRGCIYCKEMHEKVF